MKKIVILMSTYNGEKYIEEQLNSLIKLKTDKIQLEISIRDDGSTDKTIEILDTYSKKYKNIRYYIGNNKGPLYSFLELLYKENGYDYYAFCDQDDYWQEEKIISAINQIKDFEEIPTLYFSALNIVNKDLEFVEKTKLKVNLSLDSLLMVNPAVGCTIVFNNKLKEIIQLSSTVEGDIQMHDSWIARIAKVTNSQIIYDNNSYIKYRQHGKNVMGMKNNKNPFILLKNFFKKRKRTIPKISEELLKYYKDFMDERTKNILVNIVEYSKTHSLKNKLFLLTKIHSNSIKENIKFKCDVLQNRF